METDTKPEQARERDEKILRGSARTKQRGEKAKAG